MNKDEEKKALGIAQGYGLAGAITTAALSYLFMSGTISLTGGLGATQLKSYAERLQFLLRFQTASLLMLVVTMVLVVRTRVSNRAFNPLKGPEQRVQGAKNVMNNTFEQFIMSFVNQLILIGNMSPANILKVIPLCTVTFVLGRIAFIIGYPERRAFGVALNFLPLLAMTGYNAYCLVTFLMKN